MSDTFFTIRIKKPDPLWLAVMISLLIHLLVVIVHFPSLVPPDQGQVATGPMQVTLAPNPNALKEGNKANEDSEKAQAVLPKPKPKVKPKPKKPKPQKVKPKEQKSAETTKTTKLKPKETEVKVLATEQAKTETPDFSVPEEMVSQAEAKKEAPLESVVPEPPSTVTKSAPTDMMSLIKQRREARAARGDPSAINALEEGKVNGQSLTKNPDEIIKENLRQPGTNGIFTVTTLNRFEGTFSFQGWRGEFSNAQRQFYRVETFNASDDIRILMVNKMIDIIRTYYAGDFQWESRRLGETVTLSARQKDHTQLVNFLLTEFQLQFEQFLRYR